MGIENRRFMFHMMMVLENNLQGLILMPLTKSFRDLGNALSSYHKEDFGELGCGLGHLASVIKDHYNDEEAQGLKMTRI